MLAYLLALVVALGSLVFYLSAFFLPEMHRRQDFLWSGVGLFYALVLWSCAGRITGAVLLGQMASVALLGGLAWQTLALRRELTPVAVRTAATWQDAWQWLETSLGRVQGYFQQRSWSAAVAAIAADLQQSLVTLRQRIAGPRGTLTPARKPTAVDSVPRKPASSRPVPSTPESEPPRTEEVPTRRALPGGERLKAGLAQITATGRGLLTGFRKPKPKRAVIDIPPRPPSIPRSPAPPAANPPPSSPLQQSVGTSRSADEAIASANPLGKTMAPGPQPIDAAPVATGADEASLSEVAVPEQPGEVGVFDDGVEQRPDGGDWPVPASPAEANGSPHPPDEVTNWDD